MDYNSDMQSDFDDLRFTDNDGVTELDYYVENYISEENAVVWVEVPSIPGGENHMIYMYYGNSTVASASNGENTFAFFDDFEDGDLNTSKWTNHSIDSEENGYLYVSTNNEGWQGATSDRTFSPSLILKHEIEYIGDLGGQGSGAHGFWESWVGGNKTTCEENDGYVGWDLNAVQRDGTGETYESTGVNMNDYWELIRITWTDSDTTYHAERADGWTDTRILSSQQSHGKPETALRG